MQAVEVGGRTLEVQVEGPDDAPVLVFSNSLGTDWRAWEPLLPHLPQGLRIVRYSKAGHGLSDMAPGQAEGGHDIEAHARDLLAVLDALDIQKATLAGLSVGGLIALALAQLAPQRLSALVLCCTAHKIGTEALWNQRIAEVRGKGLAAMADGVMERWFSADWRAGNPASLALWRNMVALQRAEGYAAICAAIRDADFTEAARTIGIPTLCVAGTEDGATPPEVVQGMARLIPGARFETLQGVGHIPCVEAPDRLGATIGSFLREHGLV